MQGGLGGGTVSMRPGIDAGESYVREVAAYILVRTRFPTVKELRSALMLGLLQIIRFERNHSVL